MKEGRASNLGCEGYGSRSTSLRHIAKCFRTRRSWSGLMATRYSLQTIWLSRFLWAATT